MKRLQNIWIDQSNRTTITNINELEFIKNDILIEDCAESKIENLEIETIFISGNIQFDKDKAIFTIKELTKIKVDNIEDIVFIHAKHESFGKFIYAVTVVNT